MAVPPPIPVDMTTGTHVVPTPYPARNWKNGGIFSLKFNYQAMKIDEEGFPPCPGCGKQAESLGEALRFSPKHRVCECGYEFWKKYTRYDIAVGSL